MLLCSVAGFLCTVSTLRARARVGTQSPQSSQTVRGSAAQQAGTYTGSGSPVLLKLLCHTSVQCDRARRTRTAAQAHRRADVRGPDRPRTRRIYGRRAAIRRTPLDGLEWYTLHSSTEYVEPNERRSYSYQRAVAMDLSQHREHKISDYEHITWSGTLSASSI